MDGALSVPGLGAIPPGELEWRYTTSSGPGGQHANRARTRVEVRFDIMASGVLDDAQRARLTRRYGASVSATAEDGRSQVRNRELAAERLARRIADGLRTRRRRVATRPSRGARERRLDEKRRRSAKKRDRNWNPD